MNFDLGPQELALQEAIRGRTKWEDLHEAGVFTLRLPEPAGAGLGMTQAVVVFEELGRSLAPGPLVGTHLRGGTVASVLHGGLVEHLDAVEEVLLVDDGVWVVEAAGAEPVERPLDPATPLHRAERVERIERLDCDPDRFALEGAALTAALLVGIASACTSKAVAYAKERIQFDRPIGSFQAVKHLCADMLVREEVARAAAYAAGVELDGGDAARAVSAAKLLAADSALHNGKACIQVHGGMGFTWELDAHLYLKRAAVLATQFGSPDEHAEAIASYV